jgi:peroxiredoxin
VVNKTRTADPVVVDKNLDSNVHPALKFFGESIMIEVGKQAPDFELASHLGGTKFTLNQFKGQKNVMLVFYPLDWTPT